MEAMSSAQCRPRIASRRPFRSLLLLGSVVAVVRYTFLEAFVGSSSQPLSRDISERFDSKVALGPRSRKWTQGTPNPILIMQEKRMQQGMPTLSNAKDQYYIMYARSAKVRQWFAFNIISAADIIKNLKDFAKNNDFVNALGGGKFAEDQAVKAIGMQLYKEQDSILESVRNMHSALNSAKEVEWGYKEIMDNEEFNENPMDFLNLVNVTKIPPEQELRNVLDDAGDALSGAGQAISTVPDKVKGLFGR
mmetsp:Transcript_31019/g.70961  ORF Transcript_31019/g.70961 Transcript_31019/m.70961 type:complete len:249 (+) Transcript_31019:65-811(+)